MPLARPRFRPLRRLRGPRSLAGQLFAMQVVLVAVVVAGCVVFAYVSADRQAAGRGRGPGCARAGPRPGSPGGG
ncbi:hypothetical protein ACWFRN_24295, partial [Streptomyces celluloflavus]